MKPKQILIAAAALAVVLVLLLVFGRPRTSSPGVHELVDQLVVPGFVPKDARLIEVTKAGSDTVRVRKTGEKWVVESGPGYEADTLRVAGLLSTIETMRIRAVRSTRAASHPDFDLDETGGIWLRVYDRDDTEIAALCIGKALSYDRCFVRRPGSDAVLEATVNLLYPLGATGPDRVPDPVSFVDKNVVRFDPVDVRTVRLERDGETVVLAKVEAEEAAVEPAAGEEAPTRATTWVLLEPEQTDANGDACDEIVRGFSKMVATGIGGARTLAECGLTMPQARVTIEFSDESGSAPVTILLGAPGPKGKRYYVVTDEQDAHIFLVSSYYRYLARRHLNDLRQAEAELPHDEPSEEPGADPGTRPSDEPDNDSGAAPIESA